jgi:hypothetical protein
MAKFELGKLYLTCGVNNLIAEDKKFAKFVLECVKKHAAGEWGKICEEDKISNEEAVRFGNLRILSAYKNRNLPKIWIITEADRSATTILFPDEY